MSTPLDYRALAIGDVNRDRPSRRALLSGALVIAGAAAIATVSASPILVAVVSLGRYIVSPDVAADYVKGVLWAIVLGVSLIFWPVTREERRTLAVLWAIRCVVTLVLMLPYEWNYESLDAFGYFQTAAEPTFEWLGPVLGNGTRLIGWFGWWHAHLFVASYHAMKVSCSMIGLIAVFLLYRAAGITLGRRMLPVLIGLACFPSVLFWSSIFGKDPIALLGIALHVYGITRWLRFGGIAGLLPAGIGLLIAVAIRLWIGPILIAPMMLVGVVRVRGWGRRALVLVTFGAALASVLLLLRDYFALAALSDGLEVVGRQSQSWAEGGSAQSLAADLSNPIELLKFLPKGAFTALFRPLPGEIMNAFGAIAGLENGLLLAILALGIKRARLKDLSDPVIIWAIAYVVVWSVIYGPISYQNLGTAVRFRLQAQPVMLLVLAYLARPRRAVDAAIDARSRPTR